MCYTVLQEDSKFVNFIVVVIGVEQTTWALDPCNDFVVTVSKYLLGFLTIVLIE